MNREGGNDKHFSTMADPSSSGDRAVMVCEVIINMDVGTGGRRGHVPPHLSKTGAKCPFLCNLAALFENFENSKMNRKIHAFGDFRRSKFQSFPGSIPPGPLSGLHCLAPQTKCSISLPKTLPTRTSIYVSPTSIMPLRP